MTDEVLLEGMRFYAYHGVNPEERSQGQRFVVDIALAADLRQAARSDDLTQTINYSSVYKQVKAVIEGPPHQLVEVVADEIARSLLAEFSLATAITVTVRKPEVPLKGATLDSAGVRVHRTREELRA